VCSFAYSHTKGFLDLTSSTLGTLILVGTQVDGDLVAVGSTVTTLYAQGLSVKLNVMAMKAHFVTQISVDDLNVQGGLMLSGAIFDNLFKPTRVKAKGMFNLDGATFKASVMFDDVACATFSMSGANITGDTSIVDLDAGIVLLATTQFGGALRFERGCVRGVFDIRRVTVAGDFVLERTELQGGTDLAGVVAASLQLLDVTCADIYAQYPITLALANAAVADVSRPSTFESVSVLRSDLKSLRPAQWDVRGELAVGSSTIGFCLIEDNHVGSFVLSDTKFIDALFVGRTIFRDDVRLINVDAEGPVVFQGNTIQGSLDIRLSRFGRLDFNQQSLPQRLACTSSTVKQLRFDEFTSRRALKDDRRHRYDGCTIDLESSTYDQVICNVADLARSLAPKESRQQFVVLERALRQSGFDELADTVYRKGRTRYYESVKRTDFGVWLRGAIANWTTGYGLSVFRITVLTISVPLLLFFLVWLSPGTASVSDAAQSCTSNTGWTTAAAAVGATYLGEGSTKAHLTDCRLLGLVPAHGIALPLRLLGIILLPIWLVIVTGILKYAVKSG
jgi:hypothetical protein